MPHLKFGGGNTHLLGQIGSRGNVLHQTAARVMFTMPMNLLGASRVEQEAKGALALLTVLENLTADIVAVTKLIHEALSCKERRKRMRSH